MHKGRTHAVSVDTKQEARPLLESVGTPHQSEALGQALRSCWSKTSWIKQFELLLQHVSFEQQVQDRVTRSLCCVPSVVVLSHQPSDQVKLCPVGV